MLEAFKRYHQESVTYIGEEAFYLSYLSALYFESEEPIDG